MTTMQPAPHSPTLQSGQYRALGQAQITECTHAFTFTVPHQPDEQLSRFSQVHLLAGLGVFTYAQSIFQLFEQYLRVIYCDAHVISYSVVEPTSNVEQGTTGAKEENQLFFYHAKDLAFSNLDSVLENPAITGAAHG